MIGGERRVGWPEMETEKVEKESDKIRQRE